MNCPVCETGHLIFVGGYPPTLEEPGEIDYLYCDECDTQYEIEKFIMFDEWGDAIG